MIQLTDISRKFSPYISSSNLSDFLRGLMCFSIYNSQIHSSVYKSWRKIPATNQHEDEHDNKFLFFHSEADQNKHTFSKALEFKYSVGDLQSNSCGKSSLNWPDCGRYRLLGMDSEMKPHLV